MCGYEKISVEEGRILDGPFRNIIQMLGGCREMTVPYNILRDSLELITIYCRKTVFPDNPLVLRHTERLSYGITNMVCASLDNSEPSVPALSMDEVLKEMFRVVSSLKVGAAAYFSMAVISPAETSSME